ncbi:MAG: aldo/keto reductase family oxidoreductase, partial [Clostridiales bacterium]|nr:aldo/keto reductase family oxidoreductase [Clostridiales bacterium]
MKHIQAAGGLDVPVIVLGCMRISDMKVSEVAALVDAAVESGVTFFDHAGIYGGGKSEEVFG